VVKSDIDQLLAQARNGSTAGCKITAVLDSLDSATAGKVRAALLERKAGNPRQWAYVASKLVDVLLTLSPASGVTLSSVVNYRKNHRG
jgi:hypothetical protein